MTRTNHQAVARDLSSFLQALARRTTRKQVDSYLLQPDNPAEGLVSDDDWKHMGRALGLSALATGLARLWFEGAPVGPIATACGIEKSTVRRTLERLYRRLHVRTRPQFVLRVLRVREKLPPPRGKKISKKIR